MHVLAVGSAANVFSLQTEQCACPFALLARPGMHGRHDAEVLSGWWKPRGHSVHCPAFWISENCPAAQSTHVLSALFSRLPALHAEHDALPLPAVRPAWQFSQLMASGALAGVAAQTVVYPLDVLRRRVQLDRAGLGALGTLRAVVAREGWRALFAGIVPTYLKTVPAVATTATVCVSLVSHFKQANAASTA